MRIQLTSIERFDRAVPGLQLAVDMMLDQDKELTEIHVMLLTRFKLDIPEKTISNYKQRRYLPEKEKWEETLSQQKALVEVVEKYGLDNVTKATILEQLQEARQRGERASMKDLLREDRERQRLEIEKQGLEVEKQKVENEKQSLELRLKQAEGKLERVKETVGVGAESPEKADPAEVRRRIQEIFGM